MKLQHFFDKQTFTLTYVVYDPTSRDAVIIDPVLNYSQGGAYISLSSFDELTSWIDEHNLHPRLVLETHAHADHLSSCQYLKSKYPGLCIAIHERITEVQTLFKDIFAMEDLETDGSQFDHLLKDGEELQAGTLSFKAIHTPGHTPACASYLFRNWVFVGDLIFMPDFGTGRCDFPGGSAAKSYHSIMHKLYQLPDTTMMYVGHDYMPNGRPLMFQTTIGDQKTSNIHIKAETSEEGFVTFRTGRDLSLSVPQLLNESVQFNINAGHLPPVRANGRRYFQLPLTIEGEVKKAQS